MNFFENVQIIFQASILYLFLGILLFSFYTYYIYKYTLPPTSKLGRALLILIRITALIFILGLILEPKLIITDKENIEPVNLVFIDNSKSIGQIDSSYYTEKVSELVTTISDQVEGEKIFLTFDRSVNTTNPDSLNSLPLDGLLTNYENIFEFIKNTEENLSTITLVSDGILNDGASPIYSAERLRAPLFTIGYGDSSKYSDISVSRIKSNQYIYNNEKTTIKAVLLSQSIKSGQQQVYLYEDGNLLERKTIKLPTAGIKEVEFDYKPESAGEKKLTVTVISNTPEKITSNNSKSVFVNVLEDKINILLLTGSPSEDYAFFKRAFESEKKYKVNSLTQINENKFLENETPSELIDSADVFFLVGFPSNITSNELLTAIINSIRNDNKPYFFSLARGTDLTKLDKFEYELPISFSSNSGIFLRAQISVNSDLSGIMKTGDNGTDLWNQLPPILIPDLNILLKPGSSILAEATLNNGLSRRPLIISRKSGSAKVIAVLGRNIWRWKLQPNENNNFLFDNFITNSIRWLSQPDDKKLFNVTTTKRIYVAGEEILFTAQLYDETLTPVEQASVYVSIRGNDNSFEVPLYHTNNGIYEGIFQPTDFEDFTYSGSANYNNQDSKSKTGRFSVTSIDPESNNLTMNKEFLNQLAHLSNGRYFNIDNYEEIIPEINKFAKINRLEKSDKKEYALWTDERFLILIILLFSIEWFLRKRTGML